jgi:hypothetical protein
LRRQRAAEERALADECALTARHRNVLLDDLPMMSAPEGTLRVEVKTPLPPMTSRRLMETHGESS